MALEQVLEEIQRKGQEERTRLEAEAQEARAKLVARAQEAVEEHRRKGLERATREIVRIQTQEAASTELELKREELQMERELLDRVLHLAQEKLKILPRERNEAVLKALLAHFEREGTQVEAAAKDELFVKIASRLHFKGALSGSGGLVISNAEGTVQVDLTFETLMRDLTEKRLKEVHVKMFGGLA
ncbi:MAG TPA: V-type ATP synthase subunit E family protein [Candidatus Thermoplasmatota archaeon]|nr:V-type ATP synthase subunit E family protein [Candidatus Thermoplasmatota archaeon]